MDRYNVDTVRDGCTSEYAEPSARPNLPHVTKMVGLPGAPHTPGLCATVTRSVGLPYQW
jgi:hypothetical protein